MTGSELLSIATILAILLGPVSAIQVSSILEQRRGARERKERIFKILMATRAAILSPEHIQTLNAIDVEFYSQGDKDKNAKEVREAWQVYHDHLYTRFEPSEGATWEDKRKDLLIKLLSKMATCLGYEFGEVLIKRGGYYPTAHGEIEADQTAIRKQLLGILQGTGSFPIKITDLPPLPPPEKGGT